MRRKNHKLEIFDFDEAVPAWVDEGAPARTTPYTEQELDALVESTLESIRDTSAWENLVARAGEDDARSELRARIVMRDERANEQSRH